MSGKRRSGKRGPKFASRPTANAAIAATTKAGGRASGGASSTQTQSGRLKVRSKDEAWRASRAGARAGRGFHFQDAVGAWLAVGMLTGEVTVDRLIPEGYEDLCGEGGQPVDWQVKSRQDRVGDFSMRDVCKHALKMSVDQGRRASTARPVLILERGIKGAPLPDGVTRLHELPIDHPLREVMDSLADAPKVDRLDVDRAIERVEILVVPNSTARSGAVNALAARYGVHRAVAEKLLLAIRDRIADLVDRNASAGVDDRAVLDRTAVERLIQESLNDIDPSALTEAVRTGACAPLASGFHE